MQRKVRAHGNRLRPRRSELTEATARLIYSTRRSVEGELDVPNTPPTRT